MAAELGDLVVYVQDGVSSPCRWHYCHSTVTLDRSVPDPGAAAGNQLPAGCSYGSLVPAQTIGVSHRKGELAAGKDADLVIWDRESFSGRRDCVARNILSCRRGVKPVKTMIFPDHAAMSRYAAQMIADQVRANPASVLGLATGSTPEQTYEELVKIHREKTWSFAQVTTFNLDEYWGLAGGHPASYRYYMRNGFVQLHRYTSGADPHPPRRCGRCCSGVCSLRGAVGNPRSR